MKSVLATGRNLPARQKNESNSSNNNKRIELRKLGTSGRSHKEELGQIQDNHLMIINLCNP
jgi:hypothetical protein